MMHCVLLQEAPQTFHTTHLHSATAPVPNRSYLKAPPFSNVTLLTMKGQLPRTFSLGAAYLQGAAPDGPVAKALQEVTGLEGGKDGW